MKGWSFGETASINDGHETESAAETAAAASPRQSLTVNSLRHSPSRNSRLSSASRYTSKQQQQQQQKGGISDSTINDFSTSHTGGGGLLTGHSTLPFDSFQPSIHLTGDRNDPIQSIAASEKLDVVEDISSGLILEVESENCGNSIIIFDIAAKTPPLSENQTGVIPKEAKEDTIQFVLNGEDSASGTEENKVERTMTERTTKICESPLSSYEQLQEKNPSTLSQPAAVIITKSKASSLNNSNNNSNNDAHSSNNSQLTSENDESSLRSVEEFPHSIRPVHHASTPSNHSRTTPLLNTLLKERVLAIHQQQYRPNNPSSGGSNTSLNETTASNVAGHGRARSTSREKSNSLYSHTTSNTGSNQSLNVEGTVGGAGLNRPNHARSLSREKNIYVASQHGFSFGSLPVDLLNGGGSGGGGVGINASISGTGLVPSTGRRPSVSAGGNPGGIASPSLDWRSSIRADSVSSSQSKKNSLVTNQKMGTGDAVERYQQFLGNARRASISFNPNKSDTFLMHAWNQSASALPGLDTAGGGGGAATASSSSIRNLGNLPDIGRASFKALPFLSEGGGGISSSPASITTAAKNQPGVLDQRQNLSVSVDMPSSSFISSDLKVVLINTEALTLKSILNGLAPAPADLTSFQEFCKDPFWSGKMSISPSLLLEFWITAESLKFTKDTDSYLENIDYIIKTYINVINFPQITKNDALDNAIKAQNNVEVRSS